jgi:VWFA-related protein
MPRILLFTFFCGLLAAQTKQSVQSQQPVKPDQAGGALDQSPTFRTGVEEVVVPVIVYNRDGDYVNGLQPNQFHLFDNDKEQNIHVDVTYTPISLVILVQANANVEHYIPQVQRIGSLIAPLIIGQQGEAALIAYDAHVRRLQDFTTDTDKITEKLRNLYPGSYSNRMVDAVEDGARMLRSRPKDRRRIMLLIGETRDIGSESNAREVLHDLQFDNITFYSIDMGRLLSTLTAPPRVGRPDNLPPAAHPMPPGVPATPTTVQQIYQTNGNRMEFIPLMVEIFKDAKAIFKANPVELFTKGTGGSEYGFYRQKGLEEAIQQIGEQLHSQYVVAYTPNNKEEGGFHQIAVQIAGRPDYRTQTRPGYWVATHN